jgi:hypothetical protein
MIILLSIVGAKGEFASGLPQLTGAAVRASHPAAFPDASPTTTELQFRSLIFSQFNKNRLI